MLYMMMDYVPTISFFVFVAVIFLILTAGFAYTVSHFRHIGRNPDKHRPCADTLPCGDRALTKQDRPTSPQVMSPVQ